MARQAQSNWKDLGGHDESVIENCGEALLSEQRRWTTI
jgi:hypothetical protein